MSIIIPGNRQLVHLFGQEIGHHIRRSSQLRCVQWLLSSGGHVGNSKLLNNFNNVKTAAVWTVMLANFRKCYNIYLHRTTCSCFTVITIFFSRSQNNNWNIFANKFNCTNLWVQKNTITVLRSTSKNYCKR